MSEDAAAVLADIRRKARERKKRWRDAHPEAKRANTAARSSAEALLREMYRDEYEVEVAKAREGDDGVARQMHYRAAMKVLRSNHPNEWRDALNDARGRA